MSQRTNKSERKTPQPGELARLARELGSPRGVDPIPPDQYLTYMGDEHPETLRLWAWVLSKTIRLGHRRASCVDERGRPLRLSDAARELEIGEANVRRAWRWLEAQGRVRRDGSRLVLTGEITRGEEKAGRSVHALPPYLRLIPAPARKMLDQLPVSQAQQCKAILEALQAKRTALISQAVAYARYLSDVQIDRACESFGIIRHSGPPRQAPEVAFHQAPGEETAGRSVHAPVSTDAPGEPNLPGPSLLTQRVSEILSPYPLPETPEAPAPNVETELCARCNGSGLRIQENVRESPGRAREIQRYQVICGCAAGDELRARRVGAGGQASTPAR